MYGAQAISKRTWRSLSGWWGRRSRCRLSNDVDDVSRAMYHRAPEPRVSTAHRDQEPFPCRLFSSKIDLRNASQQAEISQPTCPAPCVRAVRSPINTASTPPSPLAPVVHNTGPESSIPARTYSPPSHAATTHGFQTTSAPSQPITAPFGIHKSLITEARHRANRNDCPDRRPLRDACREAGRSERASVGLGTHVTVQ